MVETEPELSVSSEESQTAFDGAQTWLQPPPKEEKPSGKRRKYTMVAVISFVVLVVLIGLAAAFSNPEGDLGGNGQNEEVEATAAPITDQAKENELRRVESIIEQVNPELILVAPPQVDMTVQF